MFSTPSAASNFSKNQFESQAGYWLKNSRIQLVTVQTLDAPYPSRANQASSSGHPITVQSNTSVQILDALLGSNCVVF